MVLFNIAFNTLFSYSNGNALTLILRVETSLCIAPQTIDIWKERVIVVATTTTTTTE